MSSTLRFRYFRSMKEVPPAQWDALAPAHVFTTHAWLSAFEASGLVGPGRAIEYCIPALVDSSGTLVAAAPGVMKREPLGEYGPEYAWLHDAARRGIRLLPKLQIEVPLTPVASPKFLVRPGWDRAELVRVLFQAMMDSAARGSLSALSIVRMTKQDQDALRARGLAASSEIGTRWRNEGYRSYDEFLARLKGEYRYAIRRERKDFHSHGLKVQLLRGREITAAHWDAFFAGYEAVCVRKRGPVLLNRRFFDQLAPLGDAICLMGVFAGDEFRAGTFMIAGSDTLYSRSWSELAHTPGAVFEAAMYRPAELAIELGLQWLDCGIWGPHKPKRGFEPVLVPNAHWLRDPSMEKLARAMAARHERSVLDRLGPSWHEHYLRRDAYPPPRAPTSG
ncbi:MAG TPA: GNAT family N-acetyltransferase [Ramlibacter sp.]|uniref:peptidogalycan biosysnthesis protein n=1 Tax=Ramlibacter sp. TaxID=1917967 RepID=UPI002BBCD6E7|nr:GNAT family N-acetyltransferase [Ramlibacter sp.]HVZ44009.1 GNAT family N-acetyltransferase [Ramlibacter sp.]